MFFPALAIQSPALFLKKYPPDYCREGCVMSERGECGGAALRLLHPVAQDRFDQAVHELDEPFGFLDVAADACFVAEVRFEIVG